MAEPLLRPPAIMRADGRRRLLGLGIVGLSLGLALVVGLGRLPGGPLTVVAVVGAAAGAALVLAHLEGGILLVPVVAVLVPFGVGTGTTTSLVASLLLAALLLVLWLGRLLARRDLRLVRSPVTLPLAGFMLSVVLSTVSSNAFRDPLVTFTPSFPQVQLGGLSVFVISGGLLLLVMNCLTTTRLLGWLTWIMLALGAVTIVAYMLPPGGDPGFVAIGGLFSLWVVSLAVGQALFNQRLTPRLRSALLLLAGAWLYRRLFLEFAWLSGWLPMLLAVATICALRSRRLVLLLLAASLLVGGLNYEFFTQRYESEVSGDDSQGNYQRLDVWGRAVKVTQDQLLLGLGPVGYAPYYLTYWPDDARSSHSNYLDILAQTGLIGSALFLWFIGALYATGLRARRRWPGGLAAGVANGALGGLVGMTVAMAFGDWVIPFVYNQTLAGFRFTVHSWIILGAMASLPHLPAE